MKYSGSITIKKTELISLIEDENHIFRSKVSENSKWFSFGRKTGLTQILLDDNHACYLFPLNNYPLYLFGEFWERIDQTSSRSKNIEV